MSEDIYYVYRFRASRLRSDTEALLYIRAEESARLEKEHQNETRFSKASCASTVKCEVGPVLVGNTLRLCTQAAERTHKKTSVFSGCGRSAPPRWSMVCDPRWPSTHC